MDFVQLWLRMKELDLQFQLCLQNADEAELKGETLEQVFWEAESKTFGLRYLAVMEELGLSSLDVFREVNRD